MLSLANTFDKLQWQRLTDVPVRKVTELSDALDVKPKHGADRELLSLRDVMSAAWEKVTFTNDGLKLVGYLFKPFGPGPFPAVIWNHGSENLGRDADEITDIVLDRDKVADDDKANSKAASEFGKVAKVLVPAGYVVFAPVRRGQGASEGRNIKWLVDHERNTNGDDSAGDLSILLQGGEHLRDQLAGLAFLKSLPYVDKQRLAVSGCSLGGIQTLFGAEVGAGYKAAIAMSPGAETWHREVVQDRLSTAVENIDEDIRVLLIHPNNDASLGPGYTLGQKFKNHEQYGLIIFPAYGTAEQQGHCFGGDGGAIWGPAVLEFLEWVFPR